MSASWDPESLSDFLLRQLTVPARGRPNRPQTKVDVIVTFDQGGVSHHPNHRSLYYGSRAFVGSLMRSGESEPPVQLYTLGSVNVLRKYMSILDAPASVLSTALSKRDRGSNPSPLFIVGGPGAYRKAQLAMTSAHTSQMVWFRWFWITLSRYMVINVLTRESFGDRR
jgi:N-acetylglucosaminylphosphatidylinositol deacetylase